MAPGSAEAAKVYAEDRQSFVATRMSLPLFMVGRNRIREDHMDQAHKQFQLAGKHYSQNCRKDNHPQATSAATFGHYRHITGFDKPPAHAYPEKRKLRYDRALTAWRSWQLAPNRYGVPRVPFAKRSGSKGTAFPKMHFNQSILPPTRLPHTFYDVPTGIECLQSQENRTKGVFLSNARDRRATSRFMVSQLTGCWRNPADPGPTSHYTKIYELSANSSPVTKGPTPNPHLFLPQSCVPAKQINVGRRHRSFEPAVGRYDVRFPNVCSCTAGRITMPGLTLKIEHEKRLKFRRLPYKRIKKRRYCEPDWMHVEGKGHTYRFHMAKHELPKPKPKLKKDAKKAEKNVNLNMFADAKYLNMVTHPQRGFISVRNFPVPPYVPKILYNCVAKRVVRKQLRNNKKIAFNSGQERWKDGERPLQMTMRQLEAIKASLPPDRRLTDRPLEISLTEVRSKLMHVPGHQKNAFMPKLRKRLFKFLPIPMPRVLVTDSDIRPDIPFDPEHPTGLYRQRLDEKAFFRDSVLLTMQREAEGKIDALSEMTVETINSKATLSRTSSRILIKTTLTVGVAEAASEAAAT